ncbi:MAG: asparagine synthase (glutamine-hydrolyzing) [Acidobacteriia bacterium]|nr:asparagine synthase (glutamine-hydrolyzing) [Terriglobia bacterium]
MATIMCGIAGIFGHGCESQDLHAMVKAQRHRGPDDSGLLVDVPHRAGLGHARLKIIDLSAAGSQPMTSARGNLHIVFNGEIYNYRELRQELGDYPFRSNSDTEVLLAAFERWGEACLDRLIGMFAFLLWDSDRQTLFAARDRWGVKPLYYSQAGERLYAASEIQALWRAGIGRSPDAASWANYLVHGLSDHSEATFWSGIRSLPPGHWMKWRGGQLEIGRWYDLASRTAGAEDSRSDEEVLEEYEALLIDAVRLRFRADVPVGVALSGGLDSSVLLGVTRRIQGEDSETKAFSYTTGNPCYDELPWVKQMVEHTRHPLVECRLSHREVPDLAQSVYEHECEPFGGIPTLAYARLFEIARQHGVITVLDGQGMDEQWAGYDYYARQDATAGSIQGTRSRALRPECLTEEFAGLATPLRAPDHYGNMLQNLQYSDIYYTKLPKALRFNDRVSMRSSVELREPFLDHRLFELALRQPRERKIRDGASKWGLRRIAASIAPKGIAEAPKRPVQTPQREWLRGPLKNWSSDLIEAAIECHGGAWLDARLVRRHWSEYQSGRVDNSFFVWQWISLGLASPVAAAAA